MEPPYKKCRTEWSPQPPAPLPSTLCEGAVRRSINVRHKIVWTPQPKPEPSAVKPRSRRLLDPLQRMDWELLRQVASQLDAEDRGSWRLVNKAACQALYGATTALALWLPCSAPAAAAALPQLLQRCSKITQLSLSRLPYLHSIAGRLQLPPRLAVLSISSVGRVAAAAIFPALHGLAELQTLHLAGNKLQPQDAQLLAPALLHLTGLQVLDLSRNSLGDMGVQALAPAIQKLTALTSLHLATCVCLRAGVQALAPALQHLTKLQVLDLGGNTYGHKGAALLAPAMQQLTGLVTLSLHGCQLPADGMAALYPALQRLTGLQCLHLGGSNLLGREGACAAAIQQLTGLLTLGLRWSGLNSVGVAALAPALRRLTGLTRLDLSSNPLGSHGLHALLPGIRQLASLRHLVLSDKGMYKESKLLFTEDVQHLTDLEIEWQPEADR